MNYDKSQFKHLLDKLASEEKVRNSSHSLAAHPELLRQAAVKSEALTKDSNWDTYLSRIQKDIESAENMLQQARAKLEDPKVVRYEELIQAKTVILESKAIINALNIAINYPVSIIQAHKKNKGLQKN